MSRTSGSGISYKSESTLGNATSGRTACALAQVNNNSRVTTKLTTEDLIARKPSPADFARLPRHPIYVVCDDIRSLLNVGLIFRLADAVRVERLYLCGITGHPPFPGDPRPPWVSERAERQIAKTAIQTVHYVPWEYRSSALDVVQGLKSLGVQIVSLEQTRRSVPYTSVAYRFPTCIVLGHEREGIAESVLDLADDVVEIPMYGMGNSLNVAMSFGICAYEILRCCLELEHGTSHPP